MVEVSCGWLSLHLSIGSSLTRAEINCQKLKFCVFDNLSMGQLEMPVSLLFFKGLKTCLNQACLGTTTSWLKPQAKNKKEMLAGFEVFFF